MESTTSPLTPPSAMPDAIASTNDGPSPRSESIQAAGEHTYKFNVTMTCGGCSGAIDRVLKKLDGVKTHSVSLPDQTATVVASDDLAYETVLKTIKKTGKKVNTGERDGVDMSVEVDEE